MLCLAMFVSSCAAKLEIYEGIRPENNSSDEKSLSKKGVPFRVPTPYMFEGCLTKLAKGGKCEIIFFQRIESLPSEKLYYASMNTGTFADSEFTVKLDERGNLKEIAVNSKPVLAETLDSAKSVIAALKELKEAASTASDDSKPPPPTPPCNAGEVIYEINPLREWKSPISDTKMSDNTKRIRKICKELNEPV